MELDPADRDAAYRALTSVLAPRPIGWISTVDAAGVGNLAPFSFFNAVSSRPPAVAFSPGDRDGTLKDTPRNALDTGEFVVNLATEDLIEDVDRTSVDAAGSEFDLAGLEREPSLVVGPPRVAESPAVLECTVLDSVRVGDAATTRVGTGVRPKRGRPTGSPGGRVATGPRSRADARPPSGDRLPATASLLC